MPPAGCASLTPRGYQPCPASMTAGLGAKKVRYEFSSRWASISAGHFRKTAQVVRQHRFLGLTDVGGRLWLRVLPVFAPKRVARKYSYHAGVREVCVPRTTCCGGAPKEHGSTRSSVLSAAPRSRHEVRRSSAARRPALRLSVLGLAVRPP